MPLWNSLNYSVLSHADKCLHEIKFATWLFSPISFVLLFMLTAQAYLRSTQQFTFLVDGKVFSTTEILVQYVVANTLQHTLLCELIGKVWRQVLH